MARRPRIEFAGACYHLINHGDRNEPIVADDRDREVFISTLAEVCAKTGWIVYAFCLLADHFHLVIQTSQPNLVYGMKWFLGTYTRRFNTRHGIHGHLFSGRYSAQLVQPESKWLQTVCDYVHLNPVRAGLVTTNAPVSSYPWSSLPLLRISRVERPAWLKTVSEGGFEPEPDHELDPEARIERLREDRNLALEVRLMAWCIGDPGFQDAVSRRLSSHLTEQHFGPEIQANALVQAEQIIQEELKVRGWREESLKFAMKGDVNKLEIAVRLRRETTMTLGWIAARLEMGTRSYLSHLLYWHRRKRRDGTSREDKPAEFSGWRSVKVDPESSILLTDPTLDRTGFD